MIKQQISFNFNHLYITESDFLKESNLNVEPTIKRI